MSAPDGEPERIVSWTAPETGLYQVDTEDSIEDDTYLTLLGQDQCGNQVLDTDDDSGTGLLSAIIFEANAGDKFLFVVQAYSFDPVPWYLDYLHTVVVNISEI
jgi:hypothetical protein